MERLVLNRALLTKAQAVVLVASLLVASLLVASLCRPASALTPESPEVRALADSAVKYLEGLKGKHSELGGVCLRGLAVYKYYQRYNKGRDASDIPEVKVAIAKIQEDIKTGFDPKKAHLNYSLGIAIIFLCEVDGNQKQYRAETETLLKTLYDVQRSDGSWTYHNFKTGDTSQTQYGVLGTWYAMKKGYQVPGDNLRRSVDWLIRTQDPSGAVPYQGNDPGSYTRIKQGDLRLTMSPAQLGCLYIAEDLAGLSGKTPQGGQEKSVFRSAEADKKTRGVATVAVNQGMLRRAIDDGNRFFASKFTVDFSHNFYYYLYSLERYHAMKAYSEGRRGAVAPWYDAGVKELEKTQEKSGGWDGTRGLDISTAFALLFLVRSMEIAIEETAGGQSRGGYGLPPDLTRIGLDDLRDGQVVTPSKATDFTTIMETLADADLADYAVILPTLDGIQLDPDRGKRQKQVDELRDLLSKGKFQERLAAAKILAASGDVEDVPHLIYALTDGDHRITVVARDGLRLISRKFSGYRLGDKPTKEEKEFAAGKWGEWYRSVRPSAVAVTDASEE